MSQYILDFLNEETKEELKSKFSINKEFKEHYPELSNSILNVQMDDQIIKNVINNYLNKENISLSTFSNRCHLAKQTMSKIYNHQITTSRNNLFCIIIGLKLTLEEAFYLLSLFGYAFELDSPVDVVVFLAVKEKNYDFKLINETIFDLTEGKKYLGSK